MSIKPRLSAFLKAKNISKRDFYLQVGLANGTLDKGKNIGSDKIEKIHLAFPEINLFWLITGKGEMLNKNENENRALPTWNQIKDEVQSSLQELSETTIEELNERLKKVEDKLEKYLFPTANELLNEYDLELQELRERLDINLINTRLKSVEFKLQLLEKEMFKKDKIKSTST